MELRVGRQGVGFGQAVETNDALDFSDIDQVSAMGDGEGVSLKDFVDERVPKGEVVLDDGKVDELSGVPDRDEVIEFEFV